MTGRSWALSHECRPLPMNAYRRLHFRERALYDRSLRTTFAWLARQARVPALASVTVTVGQQCRRPPLPDVGASFPSAKAAIDGLVDAGVMPDDDPAHLHALTFLAPERGPVDRLTLTVCEHEGEPSP